MRTGDPFSRLLAAVAVLGKGVLLSPSEQQRYRKMSPISSGNQRSRLAQAFRDFHAQGTRALGTEAAKPRRNTRFDDRRDHGPQSHQGQPSSPKNS